MLASDYTAWRQFDFYEGKHPFIWQVCQDGIDYAEADFEGFVVLTQTCDIIRDPEKRPVVEVAPLVNKSPQEMKALAKGKSPQYLAVPALIEKGLVADLDYCMTLHKSALQEFSRSEGWKNDQELRTMTKSLTRKRGRFAFPDQIVEMFHAFQTEVEKRHGKQSPIGQFLDDLKEIRLAALPHWNAVTPRLKLIWLLSEGQDPIESEQHIEYLMTLINWDGILSGIDNDIKNLDLMTAKEYLESDALDFEYLTYSKNKS